MRVLFVSKELHKTAGSGVGARMHLDAIREVAGDDNVYVIDMSVDAKPQRNDKYIAFGKYPSKIDRIIRHLQGNTYFFSNHIIDEIVLLIAEYSIDTVFIDDSYFGKLAKRIKAECPNVRLIAFFHDVKAGLFKIWMKQARLIDKWDYSIAIKNERISVENVDANVVLNNEENDLLLKYYNKTADYYLPVCVEKSENQEVDNPYEESLKRHILFVGTSYLPNQNAVKWFAKEVIPHVRKSYDLWVVGKGLECLRDEINDIDVHIVGFAKSLTSFYVYSDVVVAPLVDGGGMKIKTAEAFSYGKVFMGSSESLHGYYDNLTDEIKNNIVFCCNSAEDYVGALNKLSGESLIKESQKLIKVYEENYSHHACVNKMNQMLFDRK